MADSAKAQHQVDKVQLEAVKAESKAQWEEARIADSPERVKSGARKSVPLLNIHKNINKTETIAYYNKIISWSLSSGLRYGGQTPISVTGGILCLRYW